MSAPVDLWSAGENYEPFIGRWSRLVAREFLPWLGVAAGTRWVDVGSGTGALTETILELCDPASVVAVEPATGFLGYARSRISDPRVSFEAAGAEDLPLADGSADAVAGALMLNFVHDQQRALAEMRRVARPGGTVAAYLWDYPGGGMQLLLHFWTAATELDPEAAQFAEGSRFEVCAPEPLQRLFEGAGLQDVVVEPIVVPTVFRDFDDYWNPFLLGQGPAPSYVTTLSDDGRAALRERLREKLAPDGDGPIRLTARAWMARGSSV
jgi:ubiquinone/menaquinone biosynthesis C-methylase UbiE